MYQYHEGVEKKTRTGGRKRKSRDKKLCHVGSAPTNTKVAEDEKERRQKVRVRGGSSKIKLKRAVVANVATPDGVKKAKVEYVVKANDPQQVRQNIITKGVVIKTELGDAVVTSRPGQDGVVNAVLLTTEAQ